ncbi:hypothetical protein [Methylorubrum podarium]|jgi:serralysin|uniref:hypothetical protein n=1 Tax=Methylorubrum podarium TaxID=200476 RepID=UPI001EE23BD7|nr:hypothetical protein [Methylorubrum podarium]GJE70522.1 hypothetical protein CHKEEEPN_2060 [Methylorubrum podarium]
MILDLDEAETRCRPVAVDGPLVEAERIRLGIAFARSLADACSWADEMRYPALSCD